MRDLRRRGARLNPPAAREEIEAFERHAGLRLTSDVCTLYRSFNGLAGVPDPRSQIAIWSLDKVAAETPSLDLKPHEFAFGDFLIHSDFYICSFSMPDYPVRTLDTNEVCAPSFWTFFDRLTHGVFDFLP